ncbi:hypothetical protein M5689_018814 [Euphorbia peplus]|nr:hypothetical protein M5689_018814 [Euphorbia peplus]
MASRASSDPEVSASAIPSSANGDTEFTLVTDNASSFVTPSSAPFLNPFSASSNTPNISSQYPFSSWSGGAYPEPHTAPIWTHPTRRLLLLPSSSLFFYTSAAHCSSTLLRTALLPPL